MALMRERKSSMEDYRIFAEELVKEAGARVREASVGAFETMHKGGDEKNVVTSVDLEVNKFLISSIRARYPEHRISSEEGGNGAAQSEWEWVLDPIDGSANFARGIPHFCVSAALLQNDMPVVGAVYNPITDELFSFTKGSGVLCNSVPVSASGISELRKAQVMYIIGHYAPLWDWGAAVYRNLVEHSKKLKAFGSSSLDLCFVAAGRADLVIYGTLSTRDCAAAVGMIREAGGEVYSLSDGAPVSISGETRTVVAVATPKLFENVRGMLHEELYPRS